MIRKREKRMKKILIYTILMLSVLGLVGCHTESSDIITTSFIGYDFTNKIVKDKLDVKLITPLASDFHHYEPTSKDLVTIKKAEVFIYLGFEYETWLVNENTLNNYLNKDALSISLDNFNHSHEIEEDLHEEENHDHHEHNHDHDHHHGEHFWTNPDIATVMIVHLAEALGEKYPEYKDEFMLNASNYVSRITENINDLKTFLMNYEEPTIYYTGHLALANFAEYFHLNIRALEESVNPGTDITSDEVNQFVKELKDNNINYLFTEELKPLQTAYAIEELLGRKLNLKELHGYHSVSQTDFDQNISYNDLLSRNIQYIKEALQNG